MRAFSRNVHMVTVLQWWARFCLLGGGILIAICASVWGYAYLYQWFQSRRFNAVAPSVSEAAVSQCGDAERASIRHISIEGTSIGRIEVPRLELSVVILEGDDERALLRGAGHIPGTAWPGETGNVRIATHRDTFFRALRNIHQSDDIRLTTSEGAYVYRVESTRIVEPTETEVPR